MQSRMLGFPSPATKQFVQVPETQSPVTFFLTQSNRQKEKAKEKKASKCRTRIFVRPFNL